MMKAKISSKTKLNKEQILKKKGLNNKGTAQVQFTKLMAKEMNNYVPYSKGRLKESIKLTEDKVIYYQPYARRQYYTNKRGGERNRSGRRGKKWDIRTWAERKLSILKQLAKIIGGRVK